MPVCRPTALVATALLLLGTAAQALDLQGHRGARGLAPENTLPAFERALAVGVDTLELDVGVTADGVVVVAHDPFLNPSLARDATGQWLAGPGPTIRSLTLQQLGGYDVGRIRPDSAYARSFPHQQPQDGARIPTLSSVFALAAERGAPVRFNIETKIDPNRPEDTVAPDAMATALLQAIRAAGMSERVSVQSFDWRTLRIVQERAPGIPTVCLTARTANVDSTADSRWTAGLRLADHGNSVPRLARAAGCTTWSPNAGALTREALKEAQDAGMKVVPWTVNEPADMDRLIGWGVDGLITDYPDRAREVMRARWMELPPAFP
ncbi:MULTISPECIES: glycerophosphodiester phosphodiesterase [Ramlibacter]|uniref:Glycerophosphodiester phosphodiesterase n=1 Tax=Ramlibacter pinisoli TaxID=2682844 RepID=A0A6N8IRY7_9BURK|nr:MULTISPECIES: glycerophosphodiester phosphodiesterase [Ramlibacter]MBA2963900.1 glycerophosphodiester phosphodiesterase [Ramlibacter sp. CGMCC 1.13660]MVQ28866.1 glycerophosphodiester phosphodiesterase [Ramlibacter pinisoli]